MRIKGTFGPKVDKAPLTREQLAHLCYGWILGHGRLFPFYSPEHRKQVWKRCKAYILSLEGQKIPDTFRYTVSRETPPRAFLEYEPTACKRWQKEKPFSGVQEARQGSNGESGG